MKVRNNLPIYIKIIFFTIVIIVFSGYAYYAMNEQNNYYKNMIIDHWYDKQESILNSSLFEDEILEYKDNNFFSKKILKRLKKGNGDLFFCYKNGIVIYERNKIFTRKYKNRKVKSVYNDYKDIGKILKKKSLKKIIKGKDGKDIFTHEILDMKEHMIWKSIKVNQDVFVIGIISSSENILNSSYSPKVFNNTHPVLLLSIAIMIMYTIFITFREMNITLFKRKLIKEKEEVEKKLSELYIKYDDISELLVKLSTKDLLTGVYSRKFFEDILINIEKNDFLPISIALIKINELQDINQHDGSEMGDQVIKMVGNCCMDCCENNDIICRSVDAAFSIVMINTDKNHAKKKLKQISKKIKKQKIYKSKITMSYGIGTKINLNTSIFEVRKQAQIDLLKQKNNEK